MEILNEQQIIQKVNRLAFEIFENNHMEKEVQLIGINSTGMKFAKLLQDKLQSISKIEFPLAQLRINPRDPINPAAKLDIPTQQLVDKTVIIVDDVANSGRTMFYACKPLMEVLPKKLETVVLVDRTHKNFPIQVNYFGLSLATTLKENIRVDLLNDGPMSVSME